MAIGDAISTDLGSGTESLQPASGVEIQVTAISKSATTDALAITDGSSPRTFIAAGLSTIAAEGAAANMGWPAQNISVMITNSIYLQKLGTTDTIYVMGVQTNV